MFPCEVSTPVILATRFNNEICILGDFNTRFSLSKNYRSYTFEIIKTITTLRRHIMTSFRNLLA